MDLLVRGGGQRTGSGRAAVRDDPPLVPPTAGRRVGGGRCQSFCRTAGAGTPSRRQVTPVVMATDRAVSVPPSKSRTPAGDAAVRRTTVSATTSTWPSSPSPAPSSAGGDPRAVVAVGGPVVDQTSARTCPGGVTGLTMEVNDPGRRGTALGGGARDLCGRKRRSRRRRTAGPGPAAAVRACPGRSWRGNHRGDHRRAARRRAMGDRRGPLRRRRLT
jgi:hypothetical protein